MAKFRLGAFATSISGASGNVVYARTAGGIVVRNRPRRNNPQTPAQQDNRARMARAVVAWSGMDPAVAALWRAYAESLAVTDPETGLPRAPKAMNVFTSLYAKLLQIDPHAGPPAEPPANPFFGDNLAVQVAPAGPGQVVFTANAPNAGGVTTELLLQRLPGRNVRTYLQRYRHVAFHAFVVGGLSTTVTAEPGWWACGVRFVNVQTGQATPVVEVGRVTVAP